MSRRHRRAPMLSVIGRSRRDSPARCVRWRRRRRRDSSSTTTDRAPVITTAPTSASLTTTATTTTVGGGADDRRICHRRCFGHGDQCQPGRRRRGTHDRAVDGGRLHDGRARQLFARHARSHQDLSRPRQPAGAPGGRVAKAAFGGGDIEILEMGTPPPVDGGDAWAPPCWWRWATTSPTRRSTNCRASPPRPRRRRRPPADSTESTTASTTA